MYNTFNELRPEQTSWTFHSTSRFFHVGWNVGIVCAITKLVKFRKRRKKSYATCFDADVWIFHVGLVWWGVPSNIHKFLLNCNSNFLMCFWILNFVSIKNIYCGMRKVQDHELQQRRTRYTWNDRENLRKPSERKWYCKKSQRREGKGGEHCKKNQIKRREGLDRWGNSLLIDMLEEKPCLWDVSDKGCMKRSLFFGYKHRIHQSKN